MGEGSIHWFRLPAIRGVEVMDVRGVSRKWAHHHETFCFCAVHQVDHDVEVPWLYRGKEHVMHLGGTQLMEPGELHSNVRCAPRGDFGALFIELSSFQELLGLANGHAGGPPALRTGQTFDPSVEARVKRVLRSVVAGDAVDANDALLELVTMLSESRLFEQNIHPPRDRRERQLALRARRLLLERWNEVVTVSELVQDLRSPWSTLAHAFKHTFGIGLRQYRRRIRLERSRQLLRESDGTVADAATTSGFSDLATFCHAFKEFFGVTPTAYRDAVHGKLAARLPVGPAKI